MVQLTAPVWARDDFQGWVEAEGDARRAEQLPDSAGNLPLNGTREQTQLKCHKCHVGGDIPSLPGTCGHSQARGREAVPVSELWRAGS